MNIRMIMLTAMFALVIPGCQQEQGTNLSNTYDLNISIDTKQIKINMDNYLYLTVENISSIPVKMPEGMLVLEFTSYSGSVVETVALTSGMLEAHPDWEKYKDYTLQPEEKINLRVDLENVLFGGDGITPLRLPTDSYALNAYITRDQEINTASNGNKLRSNYLYVDIISNHDELSLVQD